MTKQSTGPQGPDKSEFLVVKGRDGAYRWRASNRDGKVVHPNFGTIRIATNEADDRSDAYRRSARIIADILRDEMSTRKKPGLIAIKKKKKKSAGITHRVAKGRTRVRNGPLTTTTE